jgi:hypothetical protein
MLQSFEQSRKAMENCMNLFQNNLKASPWSASSDLSKQMQGYMEKNLAAASARGRASNGRDRAKY